MALTRVKQNLWMNGITGERITAIRDSEIYATSSRDIKNLYITELGNLSCSKSYDVTTTTTDDIIEVLETKYGFYIVLTKTAIFKFKNEDHTQIGSSVTHNIVNAENLENASIVDKFLFISFLDKTKVFDISDGNITETNFISTISLPIEKKKNMTIDIYKKISATVGSTTVTKLALVYTDSDPELASDVNNNIIIPGRNAIMKRLYKDFKSVLDLDSVDKNNLNEGDYIGVFRRFRENETDSKMIINNVEVEFTGIVNDTTYKGDYFTKLQGIGAAGTALKEGKLFYGHLTKMTDDIVDAGLMQSRMYILTKDRLYFSRAFDYNDFRNGIETEDPFYIQPSPINGVASILLKCKSGAGLYILSDRGIFMVGYNKVLSPTTIIVNTISDTPATKQCELVDNVFFFISNERKLMAMQASTQKVTDNFFTFFAEKYDIDDRFKFLTRATINNKQTLIGIKENDNKFVYVYDTKGTNEFRKTKIEIDFVTDMNINKIFSVGSSFIAKEKVGVLSKNNSLTTRIFMSPPYTETKEGGTTLNDAGTRITKIALKVINGNGKAIKGVTLAGVRTSKVGSNLEDLFSIYEVKCNVKLNNGYEIVIDTNNNEETLEVLGVETWLNVASS